MSLFTSNLEALSVTNPSLASSLSFIETNARYEAFIEENSSISLNLVDTQTMIPLYITQPKETIASQIDEFQTYASYAYLYMFGIGNGALAKHLLANPALERLVVFEPEDEILYVILNVVDFSTELASGRLIIHGKDQLNFTALLPLFKEMSAQRYARLYDLLVATPWYAQRFDELIIDTNRLLLEVIHHSVQIAGNSLEDALIGVKHHFSNLSMLLKTPSLSQFFSHSRTTKVAVLVSTGPSLDKQIPLLKEVAPYVTIFAVDASFPVLVKHGITPDVVVSIERTPSTSKFFNPIPKEAFDGVVFALSSIQHPDLIKSIKGGTLQMSMRPFGYTRLLGPDQWGYVGIGMSSANMAYELIYHSHFETCVLIGQDLAYGEDGNSHAAGHVFGTKEVKHSERDGWVERYGGGGKVRTTGIWRMFLDFFEKDVDTANERMQTINATEGGARIHGTVELPFKEVIETRINKSFMKLPMNPLQMKSEDIKAIASTLKKNTDKLQHYIQKCQKETESLFLEVAQLCEKVDEGNQVAFETLEKLLKKVFRIRRWFKDEMFEKGIWHVAQAILMVQEMYIATIEAQHVTTEEEKYQQYVQWLQAYKGWLFSLAGSMNAISQTMNYARARALIYEVDAIDVILNGEKIDQIDCESMKAKNGMLFDVDMRGIVYDVPDIYQEKIDKIVFIDSKSSKVFPKAFVDVICRDDEQYNELSFLKSLEEPIDEEKMKGLYSKKTIGFLATKNNLEDEKFVEVVKKIATLYKGNVKALYLDSISEERISQIFEGFPVSSHLVKSIYDIASHISVYLQNLKDNVPYLAPIFERYSNQVYCLVFNSTNGDSTVASFNQQYKASGHPILTDPEYFGISANDITKNDSKLFQILENQIFEPLPLEIDKMLYKDYLFEHKLKYLIENDRYREYFIQYARKYIEKYGS